MKRIDLEGVSQASMERLRKQGDRMLERLGIERKKAALIEREKAKRKYEPIAEAATAEPTADPAEPPKRPHRNARSLLTGNYLVGINVTVLQ